MGKIVAEMILAAWFGWSWWTSFGNTDGREYDQMQRTAQVQEAAEERESPSAAGSRSVFSAYIVDGLDCMDDGSYDDYGEFETNLVSSEDERDTDTPKDRFPKMHFGYMGLDLTDYVREGKGEQPEYYNHKAFCSDRFYMEYPWNWYVGSTDASPLTFVPEWEEEASGQFIRDWREYFDEHLEGNIHEVQDYVSKGGINNYLEKAMGKQVTDEYEYVLRESDSDWLLIYDLKKGEREAAEIIIWCNLGKMNVRNWDVELSVNPEEDYGRILVFQEWKTHDFSSAEAIKEYMYTSDFLYSLLGTALEQNVRDEIIRIDKEVYTTPYHEFVRAEIGILDQDQPERLLRQASVYIPVTRSYQDNWIVVFESFPGSKEREGVSNAQVRERIMSTFVALPYRHRVKKGENLSMIAKYYGEEPDLAYEIAAYKWNHINQPDLIYPGKEIEIPLRVLFRKIHH